MRVFVFVFFFLSGEKMNTRTLRLSVKLLVCLCVWCLWVFGCLVLYAGLLCV